MQNISYPTAQAEVKNRAARFHSHRYDLKSKLIHLGCELHTLIHILSLVIRSLDIVNIVEVGLVA
jgi:hypothetical protein